MLSHEEERDMRWNDFRNKYGHYPNEDFCDLCQTYFNVEDLLSVKFVSDVKTWIGKTCDYCLKDVRKRLSKTSGSDNKPVQLTLQFLDVDSTSIGKSRP